MPVRRRRPPRPAKRPEAARVLKVTSSGQWEKLLAKLGDRLLVIHFTATWEKASQIVRYFLNETAKRPQFSHVVFAEIDVHQFPDVAQKVGVQTCPTIVCWKHGECVEMSLRGEGANSAKTMEMLERHAGPRPSAPLWKKLLVRTAVAAAAVAAAALALQHLQQRQSTEARAQALDDRIKTVRQSLTLAQRRRQSKIVQQLQSRLESLSRERAEVDKMLQTAAARAAEAGVAVDAAVPQPYSSSDEEEPEATRTQAPLDNESDSDMAFDEGTEDESD